MYLIPLSLLVRVERVIRVQKGPLVKNKRSYFLLGKQQEITLSERCRNIQKLLLPLILLDSGPMESQVFASTKLQ